MNRVIILTICAAFFGGSIADDASDKKFAINVNSVELLEDVLKDDDVNVVEVNLLYDDKSKEVRINSTYKFSDFLGEYKNSSKTLKLNAGTQKEVDGAYDALDKDANQSPIWLSVNITNAGDNKDVVIDSKTWQKYTQNNSATFVGWASDANLTSYTIEDLIKMNATVGNEVHDIVVSLRADVAANTNAGNLTEILPTGKYSIFAGATKPDKDKLKDFVDKVGKENIYLALSKEDIEDYGLSGVEKVFATCIVFVAALFVKFF